MGILLGCIADDFTGATDLCNTLVRQGMRTVQLIDVPADDLPVPDADAVTVALKSRTIPPEEAVAPVAGGPALAAAGRRQADPLQILLDLRQHRPRAISARSPTRCWRRWAPTSPSPARPFPETGRTIYQGPPLRRRPAALRQPDAPPPADADDRRRPRPRAGRQTTGPGRARRLRDRSARAPRPSPSASPPCAARACATPSPTPSTTQHLFASRRRLRRPAADHRRLGHRHGPARELPPHAGCCPPTPGGGRPAGRRRASRPCSPAPARPRRWARSSAWPRPAPGPQARPARAGARPWGRRGGAWPGPGSASRRPGR